MTISSLLRVAPANPAALAAPEASTASRAEATGEPVLRVINHTVYFSGDCERCRPHCGALCCTGYGLVSLSEEEAKSGRYRFKEASEECGCSMCQRMRDAGVQYTLLKQSDGSCMYLDGERRCSIYEDRPETCKGYSCRNLPFRLVVG